MSVMYSWFIAVLGYVIQTKCVSLIQSQSFLSSIDGKSIGITSKEQSTGLITIYLTSLYFVSLLLLLPVARFYIDFSNRNKNPFEEFEEEESYELNPVTSSRSTIDQHDELLHTGTIAGNDMNNDTKLAADILKYVGKLVVLSVILVIPVFTYTLALSLSPAFDVALIQNTAAFEIVTLLYGVCGISRKNYIFRNFLVMMSSLIGILIISYTKATCDLLAGKLSVNQVTGEVTDPFLFDRLKGALICGLGTLPVGLFGVLWNRWFNNNDESTLSAKYLNFNIFSRCSNDTKSDKKLLIQCTHLSLIGFIGTLLIFPFTPSISLSIKIVSLLYAEQTFWLTLMCSIFIGTLPHLFSILNLNRKNPPEFLTTCNFGSIIFMGLAEWVCEPTQTTIVRWEVIGYIMLSLGCIFLSVTLV
ncbi:hypothetical protein KAFR_0F02360 [Kazachstania africana CBS 2517]|uniref:Uncharacterized protein n=1 Tax=Kazachstania africana (strain ATCC 22294 / BCRC 22015 / CBS 2517 / CECT 1963 / NBRC 1671 / NRRL Y-8276) TaxID=1071382 RepID=H2AWT3_KAZAF|nr:hypothetical protein KAFR_0F02360 [Kazachstania africana CBS 2517]CCF58833.1 hypothetical protein KAFR_0F02360 [Kazachstania africana CBS 2517]